MNITRLFAAGGVLAASLVLVACGGGSSDTATKPAVTATKSAGTSTLSVKSVNGIGDVLVDSQGRALYASDLEADGKVACVKGCTAFWQPLPVDSGMPAAPAEIGKLGVVKRPDGTRQVTAGGKLLYTFTEDSPGKVTGNGFSDDFDGRHFTWTAVLAGGKKADSSGAVGGY
jgi:predicted lipoprotein with Yx(FWY)xxD motif